MMLPRKNATPRLTVPAPTGVPNKDQFQLKLLVPSKLFLDLPQEFAESLAPTAKDKINPKTRDARTRGKPYSF